MHYVSIDMLDKVVASDKLEHSTVRIFIYLLSKTDNKGYIHERTSLKRISSYCNVGYATASKGVSLMREYNMIETKINIGVETHYRVLPLEQWAL